ncbi:MAG: FAD-dependent oxidoreductase, partial [Actinomycetota bacterium]
MLVQFEGGEVRARHVILAAQAPHAASLVAPVAERAATALSQPTYGPFLSVAVETNETTAMPYDDVFAMATPNRVFDMFTNQAQALRPAGRRPGGSLMLFAGAQRAAALMRKTDDEIVERFLEDLGELYPQTRGDEIEAFAHVFFSASASTLDHGKLYAFLDPAVDRFKELDEDAQREYRDILKRFVNLHSFLGQIVRVQDPIMEKTYVFAKALRSRLPSRGEGGLDLGGDAELTHLRTDKTFEGNMSLGAGASDELPPAVTGGGLGVQHEPDTELLSTIVDLLNERFGLNLGNADQLLFDQFREEWVQNPDLQNQAKANPIENFKFGFDKVFDATIIERMGANDDIFREIMDNPDFAATIKGFYLKEVYDRLRHDGDCVGDHWKLPRDDHRNSPPL